jgi:hypothetical protein
LNWRHNSSGRCNPRDIKVQTSFCARLCIAEIKLVKMSIARYKVELLTGVGRQEVG